MTSAQDPQSIAHETLCLREPAYLKHYRGGRFHTWRGVSFVGSELPGAGFNFAAVLRPDAPSLDELLPVAREFFASCKTGWGVLVEGDAKHPMEDELRKREWKVDEDEPAFVLPGLAAVALRPNTEFVIRAVETDEGAEAYRTLTATAFEAPPELAELIIPSPALAFDTDIKLFLGYAGGVAVSAAGYSRSDTTAVLWGVATLKEHRGRGYGDAICRFALAHAAGRGCATASLRSGPKSVPVYKRIGFRYVCQHRTYAAPASV